MLPAVFTSLLQYAFKIYLMDNLKRMLGTDFALIVCKMSSSNSREFGAQFPYMDCHAHFLL